MIQLLRISAKTMVLATFFVCSAARAESNWMDAIGLGLDGATRWLNRVGEKSEDFLNPKDSLLSGLPVNDFSGLAVDTRTVEQTYPVLEAPVISLSNRFGEIRVTTWDNPVVRVVARITVGASSAETANQISRAIELLGAATEGHLEVKAAEPDVLGMGKVQIQVNYEVTIPKDASLECANTLGDIIVSGVGGALRIDCLYGKVELHDIRGAATVRAHGPWPLKADGLRQGGRFDLTDAVSEFHRVAGTLSIRSSSGSVELRKLDEEAAVDVHSTSGAIVLYVPDGAKPDITATVFFGELRSDVPLEQTVRGNWLLGRGANPGAKQRLELHTTFNSIAIRREGAQPASAGPPLPGDTEPFNDIITRTIPVAEEAELIVDAGLGDIRIVGIDENAVHIKATKLARLQTAANARVALEALVLHITEAPNRVSVQSFVVGDMAALGCSSYRVDIEIECPRTVALKVISKNGRTAILETGGPISVDQSEGTVAIEHAKGPLVLKNARGNIDVVNCAGPVDAAAANGAITTRNVFAKQTLTCEQGKTVVDAPQGELFVRNRGGDVRVIAIEGVGGNYDILAERGHLSIVLPATANTQVLVEAKNGKVHVNNGLSLAGSIAKDVQRFQGTLGTGQFTLTLKSDTGDIMLD